MRGFYFRHLVIGMVLLQFFVPAKAQVQHPVYPPDIADIERIKQEVEPFIQLSLEEVIAEVPTASGIFFIGCPHCHGGAEEAGVLAWKPGMGDKVRCNYCDMVFPNEQFPNNREKVIIAPSGAKQIYRYHEDAEGTQYFFEAHAWYERWGWIQSQAVQLAKAWFATHDNEYGDRAAAIAGRFAQLYPDYAIRYDYPHRPVQFFPADQKWPFEGMNPYRGAKWSWWGYYDIPTQLNEVYDMLSAGYDWKRMDGLIGPRTDKRIESDLLRLGYEVTTANPEVYSNISPFTYSSMIRVGRVLGDPSMVHEAVKRFREFFSKGFFADGWWKEGSTSYHNQTIGGLKQVVEALTGYTDPPDWKGERFEDLDVAKEIPLYQKALDIREHAILPNGRKIPINDTWWFDRSAESKRTVSRLWPSLGNAALGTGEGEDQVMLNVNWSGNYGHSHYDNASILLYAMGEELLPDIGYTHTKYRGWTIYTASHNTVVIDQKGQDAGSLEKPATGRLMFYDDADEHVKVLDVDASPAYAIAGTYRRRLVMVHVAPGYDYVVDQFDVEGGKEHDWFLHGMCEEEGTLETSIPLDRPMGTLVPEWGGNNLPKTQYDTDMDGKRFHAYTYLRDIQSGSASAPWTATWRYAKSGLRTHVVSPQEAQVFRFKSPSVRMADEDDSKIADFYRNGLMQRNSGGISRFLVVHEPFSEEPWIESVQKRGEVVHIRYRLEGKLIEDEVVLDDDGKISVSSSAGWEYRSGTPHIGTIEGFEAKNGKWTLVLDKEIPQVPYIRLDLADGGTSYYPVSAINGRRVELQSDPGFTMDAEGKMSFYTFPGQVHEGPTRYTVFVPGK